MNPKVGDQFQLQGDQGRNIRVRVTRVSETSATMDGNHPLAGKDLTFEVELVEIVGA